MNNQREGSTESNAAEQNRPPGKRLRFFKKTDGEGKEHKIWFKIPKRKRGDPKIRLPQPIGYRHNTKKRAAAKRARNARLVAQHQRQAKRRKAKKANRG